jgi:ribonuclease P protein component
MFPKNKRIPRKLFPLLSNGPKTFKNNLFLLKLVSTESGGRFCFSVSKKIAKNAVVRNRLRRSGYRFLKIHLPEIKIRVLALFSFREVPEGDREIIRSLESILKESKLIK